MILKDPEYIEVRMIEKAFGGSIVAPVCDKAKIFCELAGTDYLTDNQLYLIRKLGFEPKPPKQKPTPDKETI